MNIMKINAKNYLPLIFSLFLTSYTTFAQKLPQLIPYRKGNQWGFCDKNRKIIIPCTYANASPFYEGLARVSNKDEKYGFVDMKGKVVIPIKYDWAHSVHKGWIYVEQNREGWGNVGGFIDKTGKTIIPFQIKTPPIPLPEASRHVFSQNLMALPWIDKPGAIAKYGYIAKQGKFTIKPSFNYATRFNKGVALVHLGKDQGYGYINLDGKILFKKEKYYSSAAFSEGLARVRLNSKVPAEAMKQGFIGTDGQVVIPLGYYTFNDFKEGLVAVQKYDPKNQEGQKWGFLDKSGGLAIPFQYDQVFNFNEGIALAVKLNKVGFINKKGRTVIPFKYEYHTHAHFYDMLNISDRAGFQVGFAPVWQKGKMGFINREGKVVVEFKYEGFGEIFYEYHDYSQGLALVRFKDKEFYIDMQGNEYYQDR